MLLFFPRPASSWFVFIRTGAINSHEETSPRWHGQHWTWICSCPCQFVIFRGNFGHRYSDTGVLFVFKKPNYIINVTLLSEVIARRGSQIGKKVGTRIFWYRLQTLQLQFKMLKYHKTNIFAKECIMQLIFAVVPPMKYYLFVTFAEIVERGSHSNSLWHAMSIFRQCLHQGLIPMPTTKAVTGWIAKGKFMKTNSKRKRKTRATTNKRTKRWYLVSCMFRSSQEDWAHEDDRTVFLGWWWFERMASCEKNISSCAYKQTHVLDPQLLKPSKHSDVHCIKRLQEPNTM